MDKNVLETFIKSFSRDKISDQDVGDYEQRVFSFVEGQKWVSRPLILSPAICARYGWKCVNPNLLECVACSAKLCTQEPRIEVYDAYKSCLDKIVADLKDGHKTHCSWPLAPSPESFVKMVPLPKEEAFGQFVNRLKPCLNFECSIPQVKESVPSELGLKQEDIHSLIKLAEITLKDQNRMSAVCLAATGWTLLSKKNGEMKTYVKCNSCQRFIWVKSFHLIHAFPNDDASSAENGSNSEETPSNLENETNSGKESSSREENQTYLGRESSSAVENGTSSGSELSSKLENGSNSLKESTEKNSNNDTSCERPRKRLKLDKQDFNPLEEHRPWCRWVSLTDARDLVALKDDERKKVHPSVLGWKLYMKSLIRNISSSQDNSECSPSKEHVRSVRNLLESWTSPISS